MQARIEFTGQELVIHVPMELATQVDIQKDTAVEVSVSGGGLLVQPRRYRRKKYSLDELLEQVTDENRHEETDWGPAVGQEIWQ